MKTLLLKLNEIFDKSNNRLLRFSISFVVILTPFLCVSILVLIAVHNYLRAAVLILLLLNSFSTSTRDNKFVLAFIGLIPIGFYVATSPVFIGYMLGVQALNIGGILWDNKIMTLISGASIYGVFIAAKKTSSLYEWFVNTGIGGYFFPDYKKLKDEIALDKKTLAKLIVEKNDIINKFDEAKKDIIKWRLTATTLYDYFMLKLTNPNNLPLPSRPQVDDIDPKNAPIVIPVERIRSPEEIHQIIEEKIKESDKLIEEGEKLIIRENNAIQESKEPTKDIVSVSDSTLTVFQKVLTGAAILLGGETFRYFFNSSESIYLMKGYNLFKQYMSPSYAIVTTAVGSSMAILGVGETVNSAISITTNIVKGTQNLIEKGIKNLTDKMTSGEVPNTVQETPKKTRFMLRQERNKQLLDGIVDNIYGSLAHEKQLEHFTKQNTIEAPSIQPNSPKNVQDVSLVRKPGFQDFLNPDDYKPKYRPIEPKVSITISNGKLTIKSKEND